MSSKEVFTCPVSGKPCEYDGYCENTKEIMEHPETEAGAMLVQFASTFPESVRLIVEEDYCLNKRVTRLNELIARASGSEDLITGILVQRLQEIRDNLQRDGDYFKSHFPTDEQ